MAETDSVARDEAYEVSAAVSLKETDEETFGALIAHGRDFILQSSALEKLRADFRGFLYPQTKTGVDSEKGSDPHVYSSFCLARLRGIHHTVRSILSRLRLIEEDLKPNHQRLYWKNVGRKIRAIGFISSC